MLFLRDSMDNASEIIEMYCTFGYSRFYLFIFVIHTQMRVGE